MSSAHARSSAMIDELVAPTPEIGEVVRLDDVLTEGDDAIDQHDGVLVFGLHGDDTAARAEDELDADQVGVPARR